MLLNDIGNSPDATLRKINQHLQTNYGFKIAEDTADKDLVVIMEQLEDEIISLKVKGDDAKGSPEISKRLLVLEGIRSLREFAMAQFQSPDLQQVVDNMATFVVDDFRICGADASAFEESLRDAMKQYRSSKYRFPDDMIEQRVRQAAQSQLTQGGGMFAMEDTPEMDADLDSEFTVQEDNMAESRPNRKVEGADPFGGVGKRASAIGGHAAHVPDTPQAKHALKVLDNPSLSLAPGPGEQVPMSRGSDGRMMPSPTISGTDPMNMKGAHFATPAPKRVREGTTVKEHSNLVKNLRRLLETEVSQAEVMMAAKGFAQELQEMVEKIGRLQNEDLPPVTDQMRETYGMESASAFQTQIYGALQGVMDSLYTAKQQVDDAVSNMASTGQVTAQVDMDKNINVNVDGLGDDTGMDADLDNIGAELDAEDEFGAEDGEEPLGRAMKTEALQLKVANMRTLVEKAKKLREARG